VLRQGRKIYDAAADLRVSYNRVILAFDGKRKGSIGLEAAIATVMK